MQAIVARIAALLVLCCTPAVAAKRTYYIAADEEIWNFAPGGINALTGARLKPFDFQLGFKYHKVTYHGYTDATFQVREARPPDQAYMGMLGPVIRAEVGDTVDVVFKNNSRLPLSIHVHGLKYQKNSEGAPYHDGSVTAPKPGDAVAPGATYTYHYEVPERAGPGPMDGSSVLWMYHSHTDEVKDVNTGTIGPIVVTRKGSAKPDGSPADVDREIFAAYDEVEEQESRLLAENLADPLTNPRHIKHKGNEFDFDNSLFTINGYMYGTLPMIDVHRGERTRWYVMSTMSDFDFHAPHWHGETLTLNGMHTDVAQLGPMGMLVGDMVPDNPGTWLFHCHVNLHMDRGMVARFRTLP